MSGLPRLCAIADLMATGAKGVTLGPQDDPRQVVVVRDGDSVRAYANRCPHLLLPLEIVPDRFLDETGRHLVCRTHGARFRVTDGHCTVGPCFGDALEAVAVAVINGSVYLAEDDFLPASKRPTAREDNLP
ncbi:MAG: Rieske (2Fe-2S) protein [Hyphomicrobiaceae bacterium]